jgi:hypothetical protein
MIRAKQHLARWTGIRCVAIAFFEVIACGPFCTAGSEFRLAWTTTLHTNTDSKVALATPWAVAEDGNLLFYGTEGGLLLFDMADRSSAVCMIYGVSRTSLRPSTQAAFEATTRSSWTAMG